MKNNKKGFTLIELLAVIVILAIIMVIAVPQILGVIDKSRESAWNDNVKMIEKAIETNETILSTGMATTDANSAISVYATNGCTSANIKKVADISDDTTITPAGTQTSGSCVFDIEGTANGQFNGRAAQTMTCTQSAGCSFAAKTVQP